MKRGLVLTVCLAAALIAATAARSTATTYGLTLQVDHASLPTPAVFQLGGTLTANGEGLPVTADNGVYLDLYAGSGCNDDSWLDEDQVATDATGQFTDTASIKPLGVYSVQATWRSASNDSDTPDAVSSCVDFTVTAVAAPPAPPVSSGGENSIFLCYSTFQVDPGVWPLHIAQQLLAGGGYWVPYAVKGNVPFGTNIGGYHLICNLATGQAAGQQFAGDGGDISGPEAHTALTGQLGWYPVVP